MVVVLAAGFRQGYPTATAQRDQPATSAAGSAARRLGWSACGMYVPIGLRGEDDALDEPSRPSSRLRSRRTWPGIMSVVRRVGV